MPNEKPILIHIGRGGWTIYYPSQPTSGTPGSSLTRQVSGYGDQNTPGHHGDAVREALATGAPCIDTRTIPDNRIMSYVFGVPLVAQGKPDSPVKDRGLRQCGYGPYDYAPVSVIIELAREWGATIIQEPTK